MLKSLPVTGRFAPCLAAAALLGTAAVPASADLLFYEGFDYGDSAGSLTSVATDWTGDSQIGYVTDSLTYDNLQTTGGAAIGYTDDGTTYSVTRMFDSAIPGSELSNGFYISLLMGINSADEAVGNGESGAFTLYAPQNSSSGDTSDGRRVAVPWDSSNSNYNYNYAPMSGSDTSSGKMTLFVIHFPSAGGNAEYWIDPELGSSLPAAGTGTDTGLPTYINRITGVEFEARNLLLQLDEIRIGQSFADVVPVPEPASLALLGVGAVLVAGRRRRTSR